MRAQEFEPKKQLDEIAMNPRSLQVAAAAIPARVGMEFEMYVPNVGLANNDPDDPEPDYSYDESPDSIDDIVRFFDDGIHNTGSEIRRMERELTSEFESWQEEQIDDYIKTHLEEIIGRYLLDKQEVDPSEIDDRTQDVLKDPEYVKRITDWASRHPDDYIDQIEDFSEEVWVHDNIESMRSVVDNGIANVLWPHYEEPERGTLGLEEVAKMFMDYMGYSTVAASNTYHGSYNIWDGKKWTHKGRNKPTTCYSVEPDGSLDDPEDSDDGGVEFVSPPLSLKQMIQDLHKVRAWAGRIGAYTNKSTGLHINISIGNIDTDNVDFIKLALLLGDEYVLDQFQRSSNIYCKSALLKIQQVKGNLSLDILDIYMSKISQGLETMANQIITKHLGDKYTSIHPQLGYIEFRSPGGDWLDDNFNIIENTVLRMVVALDAACDPKKYRQEYLKKLYKIMAPESQGDPIRFFAMHAAGEMDRETLKFALLHMLRPTKKPLAAVPTAPEQVTSNERQPLIRWKLLMGGEQVYEFNAPNQAVANTYARNWILARSPEFLRDHEGQEIEVVPKTS